MMDPMNHAPSPGNDNLIQFRFASTDHDIDSLRANEVADAITGLMELAGHLATEGALGDGPAPEIRMHPPKEGSFVLEAVLGWAGENPEGAYTIVGGMGTQMAHYVGMLVRYHRNEVTEKTDQEDGTVLLTFKDDTVEEVSRPTWKALSKQKRKTKKALRNLLRPMNDEAERMEVRHGSSEESEAVSSHPSVFTAERSDYAMVAPDPEETEENIWTFTAEATIISPDFREGEKWRIRVKGENPRLATMEDEEFLMKIDEGFQIGKNDIFDITIREVSTRKNGRLNRDWYIETVNRTRQGAGDDDGDDAS